MAVLVPSLGIYSTLFVQTVPVLLAVITWDLMFSRRNKSA
jgi:hypothetical protein